eukprot:961779_1
MKQHHKCICIIFMLWISITASSFDQGYDVKIRRRRNSRCISHLDHHSNSTDFDVILADVSPFTTVTHGYMHFAPASITADIDPSTLHSSSGIIQNVNVRTPNPPSITFTFPIQWILYLLSTYFVLKYISKQATIILSIVCVIHGTNGATCVTLSSHYEWNGNSPSLSTFNGVWRETGTQDGEPYYHAYYAKMDHIYVYLYYYSGYDYPIWYIGSTLGSTNSTLVSRYCAGSSDLFSCSWYDHDGSDYWVSDSAATVSATTCPPYTTSYIDEGVAASTALGTNGATCVTLSSHYEWNGNSPLSVHSMVCGVKQEHKMVNRIMPKWIIYMFI